MDPRFEQLCPAHLPQMRLHPAEKQQQVKNGLGFTFIPEPDVGTGYLWTYPINSTCSLTIYDLEFYQDIDIEYYHPPVLTLTMGTRNDNGTTTVSETLIGHYLNDEVFHHVIPRNTALRSIGISMMPEFYERRLPGFLGHGVGDLVSVVSSLNGTVRIPEVEALFHQLADCTPSPRLAPLRYGSLLLELISQLLNWHAAYETADVSAAAQAVSEKDREAMQNLNLFLLQNYSTQVDLNSLAQMCYMSKSKLTSLFRKLYDVSIYEFILSRRIERAKELLADSRRKVSEIAAYVGYERESSFSAVFRQKTGMTPNEYRKSLSR